MERMERPSRPPLSRRLTDHHLSRFPLIPSSSGDRRTLGESKISMERRASQRFPRRCRNDWAASRSGEARRASSLHWRISIAGHLPPGWMRFSANGGIRAIEGSRPLPEPRLDTAPYPPPYPATPHTPQTLTQRWYFLRSSPRPMEHKANAITFRPSGVARAQAKHGR